MQLKRLKQLLETALVSVIPYGALVPGLADLLGLLRVGQVIRHFIEQFKLIAICKDFCFRIEELA